MRPTIPSPDAEARFARDNLLNSPMNVKEQRRLAELHRAYCRVLAGWASDVLVLRATGRDRIGWSREGGSKPYAPGCEAIDF